VLLSQDVATAAARRELYGLTDEPAT